MQRAIKLAYILPEYLSAEIPFENPPQLEIQSKVESICGCNDKEMLLFWRKDDMIDLAQGGFGAYLKLRCTRDGRVSSDALGVWYCSKGIAQHGEVGMNWNKLLPVYPIEEGLVRPGAKPGY